MYLNQISKFNCTLSRKISSKFTINIIEYKIIITS